MKKGSAPISCHSSNLPEWYWVNGLHDACIIGVEALEIPHDYKQFVTKKEQYNRNVFVLKVNADGALYDTEVKEIRVFNYKILSEHISLDGRKKVWWISDRLEDYGGYYTLEIDFQDLDSCPEDFTFKIKFERVEVDRKYMWR